MNDISFEGQEFECYMEEIEYPPCRSKRDGCEGKKWILKTIPRAGIPECMPTATGRYRKVKVKVIETFEKIPFISNDKYLEKEVSAKNGKI